MIAPAKLRPVLVLLDIPQGRIPEFAALKLIRLSNLSASDRDVIRAMQDPSFVPLCRAPVFYGLREQNAVDLNSIIRIHESTLVTRPVGRLDARELADVDRLVPALLQIDLTCEVRRQVMERWEALAHQQASEQP